MKKECKNCEYYYDSTETVFPVGRLVYCTNKKLADGRGKLFSEDFNPNKNHDCEEYKALGFWGKLSNRLLEVTD